MRCTGRLEVRTPPDAGRATPSCTEVEELRLRLEHMVALDKMKSDYMHLTVHELRSPLAIVYGYLSMIESGMLGAHPRAARGGGAVDAQRRADDPAGHTTHRDGA